jgi:hypothetical protein
MPNTPGSVEGTHVVLTGDYFRGVVETEDGYSVDATPGMILVDTLEHAQEIGFIIGEHFVENGHPADIEEDEDGNLVQRPFFHEHHGAKRFAKHPKKFQGKTKGAPSAEQRVAHPDLFGKKG